MTRQVRSSKRQTLGKIQYLLCIESIHVLQHHADQCSVNPRVAESKDCMLCAHFGQGMPESIDPFIQKGWKSHLTPLSFFLHFLFTSFLVTHE